MIPSGFGVLASRISSGAIWGIGFSERFDIMALMIPGDLFWGIGNSEREGILRSPSLLQGPVEQFCIGVSELFSESTAAI